MSLHPPKSAKVSILVLQSTGTVAASLHNVSEPPTNLRRKQKKHIYLLMYYFYRTHGCEVPIVFQYDLI